MTYRILNSKAQGVLVTTYALLFFIRRQYGKGSRKCQ